MNMPWILLIDWAFLMPYAILNHVVSFKGMAYCYKITAYGIKEGLCEISVVEYTLHCLQ